MNRKEIIEALTNLIQLDIDVVHAYDQAIKAVDDPIIKNRLRTFQAEHSDHIDGLSAKIEALQGKPANQSGRSKDAKGFVMEAFTIIRSFTGLKGALSAMKTTEEISNRYYGDIVSRQMPTEVKEMLREYFTQEKIHLEYIVNNLQSLP